MCKKAMCAVLALVIALSCCVFGGAGASAAQADNAASAAEDYGLPDSCEDGNILQCFNWTLDQIKAELPAIAGAGFTSVQTSPLQPHDGRTQWYWLYQPTNFTVGNELGSYNDLKALCAEADKYGIKIIVDVVANHLAGSKNGAWSGAIDSSLRKSEYFHNEGECTDENNRYDLTHKNMGMPDLNTENTDVQNKVAAMITSLKNAGVDGIRWDMAKHIGLPSEGSAFWQKAAIEGMYHYGEILGEPAGNSGDAVNDKLMAEYAEYIGVTDEQYSATITEGIRDGRVAKSSGNWLKRGLSADKLVYWAESHDTYGNNGWTNSLEQNEIDRAYAILGARADSQTLYLSRPFQKNNTSISYGVKGSTHFTSKEVAAVNHFHNAMLGTEEKYSTGSGCYAVCRGGGAVVVSPKNSNFDVTLVNNGSLVPSGTYTDEISGSVWTVTPTAISGRVGSSGIAVFYDADKIGSEEYYGDADMSGDVSILDATAIQRHLVSLESLSGKGLKLADGDGDGEVTILDATAIQRYLVGFKDAGSRVGKKA